MSEFNDKLVLEVEGEGSIAAPESTREGEVESNKSVQPLRIYWNPACVLHKIPDHIEQPNRVGVTLDLLKQNFDGDIFKESPRVTSEQILGFHTKEHLDSFNKVCEVPEKKFSLTKNITFNKVDGDTVAMHRTREAALRAAGAAVCAVDDIYNSKDGNGVRSMK